MAASKGRNPNYDHLEKILRDADISARTGGNGVWVVDEEHPEGHWVVQKESLDQIKKSVDSIERYLRS